MNNVKKLTIAACFPLLLAGCTVPGGNLSLDDKNVQQASDAETAIANLVDVYPLTPARVAEFKVQEPTSRPNPELALEVARYEYKVGVGDILNITVWDHPELTIPAGSYRSASESGNRVHSDGTIFYPYIGIVHVANKTVREIREDVAKRLARYIESPQVDVNVAAFRSQRVYVTGEVDTADYQAVTNIPMTLLDAVNRAGGIKADADWRNVTLTRSGVEERLSLYALMQRGDLTQNRLLQHGDIVHIPRNDAQKVFVLGEVAMPQVLKIDRAGMSLTEALSESGGVNETTANPTGIFVIRANRGLGASEKVADIYQLDISDSSALVLGTEFSLESYDVVYVTAAPVARWNRVIQQILPTVQGVKLLSDTGLSIRNWD